MSAAPTPSEFLAAETRALLTRVGRLRPFVLQETMLPAAVPAPATLVGIETLLLDERAALRALGLRYLAWLAGSGRDAPATEQQRRFASLRLRVNDHLSQLDLFSDAITQRSESEVGPWLSGLDVLASDGLRLEDGHLGEGVPLLCYLDRGPGAAIRRARTRLPGGVPNPVAIIRIPRERMVGHGIASSLLHEVGHQGAALLGLVDSLRAELTRRSAAATDADERFAWRCWASWISEIVADFWSVARLGIGSTLGLIGVVSLPRPFVFRFTLTDPHPFPWIRVAVSAAIGQQLYPDPQWAAVTRLWQELYPAGDATGAAAGAVRRLLPVVPELAAVLAQHRTPAGNTLSEVLAHPGRRPEALRRAFDDDRRVRPVVRFAALGQARWDGRLSAQEESRRVGALLTGWARDSTLQMAADATRRRPVAAAPRRLRPAIA